MFKQFSDDSCKKNRSIVRVILVGPGADPSGGDWGDRPL